MGNATTLNIVNDLKYEDCPPLFESKLNFNLNGLKYHAFLCDIDYLHFLYEPLDFALALKKSERFKDLLGARFILNRNHKTYPRDLYPYSYIEKDANLKRAINLLDLEGIKFICQSLRYQNHTIIYDLLDLRTNEDKLFFAIDMKDLEGVKHVLSRNHLSQEEYIIAIKHSYYKEQLHIAEHLIIHVLNIKNIMWNEELFQAIFSGIMRSNPSLEQEMYIQHIEKLDYYNFPTMALRSLIHSMFFMKDSSAQLPYLRYVLYSEASDDTRSLDGVMLSLFHQRDYHFTINDVVSFLALHNAGSEKMHLFFPAIGTAYVSPYYSPLKIDDKFKTHRIYIPANWDNFMGNLIHETAHALFYVLLQNNCLPYAKINSVMTEEYDRAVNDTLSSILLNFTNNKYASFYEREVRILLWLNHWHVSSYKSESLTNDLFSKLLKQDTVFPLDKKILILEEKYKEIAQEYKWNDEHKHVLERVFDYFKRSEDMKDQEFIVRLPELYVTGVSARIMDNFRPIASYWEKYISPIIEKQRSKHFDSCLSKIKGNNDISNCFLFVLNVQQAYQVWLLSATQRCEECFEHIYSSPYLIESIALQQRKEMLSFISSQLSYCTEYCYTDKNCTIIPQFSWFSNVLSYAYQQVVGCERVYNDAKLDNKLITIMQIMLQSENLLGELGARDESHEF